MEAEVVGRLLFTHRSVCREAVYTSHPLGLSKYLQDELDGAGPDMILIQNEPSPVAEPESLRLGVQHWSGELGLLAAVSVDSVCNRSVGICKTQLGF